MKQHILVALIAIFLLSSIPHAAAEGTELLRPAPGMQLTSPDKQLVIRIKDETPNGYPCVIEEAGTGKILEKLDLATTASAIYWTGDSRTIITVLQLSGGPRAFLDHHNDDGFWISSDVNLPSVGEAQNEMLFDCVPLHRRIKLTYGVTPHYLLGDGEANHYTCSFEVDPHTGAFHNMIWKPISLSTFYKMKRKYVLK